jgi:hypothetical protein
MEVEEIESQRPSYVREARSVSKTDEGGRRFLVSRPLGGAEPAQPAPYRGWSGVKVAAQKWHPTCKKRGVYVHRWRQGSPEWKSG